MTDRVGFSGFPLLLQKALSLQEEEAVRLLGVSQRLHGPRHPVRRLFRAGWAQMHHLAVREQRQKFLFRQGDQGTDRTVQVMAPAVENAPLAPVGAPVNVAIPVCHEELLRGEGETSHQRPSGPFQLDAAQFDCHRWRGSV